MPPRIEAPQAFPDIQNNVTVHHPTFGVGKVMLRTGSTAKNAKAIVKFREEGEKKLALAHANLMVDKPAEDAQPSLEGDASE